MVLNKKTIGINGIHSRIGNEITDAEFRGYTIAKLDELSRRNEESLIILEKHANNSSEIHSNHNSRILFLEDINTKQKAFINGATMVASVIGGLIAWILSKILHI